MEWFFEKIGHISICAKLLYCRASIPRFHFEMLIFVLKILTVTLNWAKHNLLFNISEVALEVKCAFLELYLKKYTWSGALYPFSKIEKNVVNLSTLLPPTHPQARQSLMRPHYSQWGWVGGGGEKSPPPAHPPGSNGWWGCISARCLVSFSSKHTPGHAGSQGFLSPIIRKGLL